MQRIRKVKSPFKAGMYLLETLTSGMYNEPLSIYREYIQNAVDSIDVLTSIKKKLAIKVDINIDPFKKTITISDNGFGVPSDIAEKTLSSIGSSDKAHSGLRGFRGIGRLGGIAFSDKAVYRTKAQGEKTESIQEWDCKKLREILADPQKSSLSIKQLFNQTTTFYQQNSRQPSGSYFEVVLEGVSSFRNHVIDIRKVRDYVSQVTPVPFHPEFSYSNKINDFFNKHLSHYGKYEIFLNGESVYKPYQNKVKITKKGYDDVIDVETFKIKIKEKIAAVGWYGIRRDLLGAIAKGNGDSGIRVRVGNILIGDAHLLDNCFREPRFNSYIIGEVHVDSPDLIPNSRRDDFVDNEIKTLFYNAIERKIGLPVSKEIRLRSRLNSEGTNIKLDSEKKLFEENYERAKIVNKIKNQKLFDNISNDFQAKKLLEKMITICQNCECFNKLLKQFKVN